MPLQPTRQAARKEVKPLQFQSQPMRPAWKFLCPTHLQFHNQEHLRTYPTLQGHARIFRDSQKRSRDSP
ncbi:hypothetical protein TNCV_1915161 [Trichonephila clavipes]|uniref:Uncharacterized protein n=1 Tax=Trichonephila clavipes TaxID=2585209 RepID=A0A8X6W0T6_TRICX|nr:hypothetical protein TNCV_1915161 [Trichonephila clavipes]